MPEIQFGCCFCGKHGADRGLALLAMDGEFEQQWWCHVECLLGQMNSHARDSYRAAFDEDDATDDD